jgi:hypothetical protein
MSKTTHKYIARLFTLVGIINLLVACNPTAHKTKANLSQSENNIFKPSQSSVHFKSKVLIRKTSPIFPPTDFKNRFNRTTSNKLIIQLAKSFNEQDNSHANNAYFAKEDAIDSKLELAVMIKNSCLTDHTKEPKRFAELKQFLQLNTQNLKREMDVQVYSAHVSQQISVNELNLRLQDEPCVLAITQNDKLMQTQSKDRIFLKQAHHRVLKTQSAYNTYFKTLSEKSPSVRIAIIDSGIDVTHPDLKNHIWKTPEGQKFVNFSKQKSALDIAGHGTHIAGLIGATIKNKIGIAVVLNSGKYEIMSIKVLNEEGLGDVVSIVNGMLYAIDNHADVINLSVGGNGFNDLFIEPIRRAYFNNIPIVIAAGNDSQSIKKYYQTAAGFGDSPGLIIVGSVDTKSLQRSAFSNFGSMVDISAPGAIDTSDPENPWTCILSTLPTYTNELGKESRNYSTEYEEGTDYGSACGTSMAAPLVTGAIGLVIKHFKANHLSYSSDYIEKIIKSSALKVRVTDSSENNVLNLERLAWILEQIHEVKPENQGIDLQKSFKKYLNDTFINLFLEDYKSSPTFATLLENLENKTLSISSLNSKLISTQEYFTMPTKELDLRIAMNIVGKQLTPYYRKLYVTSLLESSSETKVKKVLLDNVLNSLLLTREAIANMKERGVFGHPVYQSDIGKSPDEIEKLEYKRVELAEKYRAKNLRSPNSQAIQQILLEAEDAVKQESSKLEILKPEAPKLEPLRHQINQ